MELIHADILVLPMHRCVLLLVDVDGGEPDHRVGEIGELPCVRRVELGDQLDEQSLEHPKVGEHKAHGELHVGRHGLEHPTYLRVEPPDIQLLLVRLRDKGRHTHDGGLVSPPSSPA